MQVKSFHYVIPGEPTILTNMRDSNRMSWNSQKQNQMNAKFILSEQHHGPLLDGPLHMEIDFYTTIKKKSLTLTNLLKFIQEACYDVVYHGSVESLITHKYYDNNPRTEFIIREIKKSDK